MQNMIHNTLGPDALAALQFAREHALPVSTHAGSFGFIGDEQITALAHADALSPTFTLVHASALSDDSFRIIADSGANISVSAESEISAGMGYPATTKVRQHGIPLSLSVNSEAWGSGDMFAVMRATLNADRAFVHLNAHQAGTLITDNPLRAHDVLRYATTGGAHALGLDTLIGTITPGKRADLIMLRTDTPTMTPVNNPAAHIVFQAGRSDIDTVFVNGRVLKHRSELIGADPRRARHLIERSLEYLRSQIPAREWAQAQTPTR